MGRVKLVVLDGVTHVAVPTSHDADWWKLLHIHSKALIVFVGRHSGTRAQFGFTLALGTYDDEGIVTMLRQAFLDCPDDVADQHHPEFPTLVVIYKLMENDLR